MTTIIRVWYRSVRLMFSGDVTESLEIPTLPVRAEIVKEDYWQTNDGWGVEVLIRYSIADTKKED